MQAGYPEVVSSEIATIREPTVSGYPEGNKPLHVNASAASSLRSRRPQACMETSRTRTERPRCCPRSIRGGPSGESDER
jgi:hypothetical protein